MEWEMLHRLLIFSVLIITLGFFNITKVYAEPMPITEDIVKNISIHEESSSHSITFKDGVYDYEPTKKESAEGLENEEGSIKKIAIGDLNGDSVPDAAFVTEIHFAGPSIDYDLYIATGKDGKIFVSKPVHLGDRIEILSLKINAGKIYINTKVHRDNEAPGLSPTIPFHGIYALQDNALVDIKNNSKKTAEKNHNHSDYHGDTAVDVNTRNSVTQQNMSSNLTGNWSGDFELINPHGKKYTAHYSYIISQDQNDQSRFIFRQTNTLTFVNRFDAFSCNMSNTYTNSYEGIVEVKGQNINFVQQKVSNSSCGSPDTDIYRLNGSTLEAVKVDGGKINTGSLHR